VFAFSDDGTYLGMQVLAEYSNIRQWVVYDGVLYTGLSRTADGQGRMLRWSGDISDPFQFEVVGKLDLDPANLDRSHDGRLFADNLAEFRAWRNGSTRTVMAGLWMSPEIPDEGLTGSDNDIMAAGLAG
jgi:hypothetical protein